MLLIIRRIIIREYYFFQPEEKPVKPRGCRTWLFALLAIVIMVLAFLAFAYLMGWEETVRKGEAIVWDVNRDLAILMYGEPSTHRNLSYLPEINGDENHTKIILSVLDNIDERVINNINSITVLSSVSDVSLACGAQALGCASNKKTENGFTTDIIVISVDFYKDSCTSFEHTLYHEIGHVDYNTFHNDQPTLRDMEYYVESFADKYSKNTCIKSLRLFR